MAHQNWRYVITESLLIVLSLLLAFFANQWRADAEAQKQSDEALANIREEIARNKASLETVIPYHEEILTQLENYIKNKNSPRSGMLMAHLTLFAPKGLNPPVLQKSAWTISQSSNALRVNFDLLYSLSSLYFLQEVGVNKTLERMLNKVMSKSMFENKRDFMPDLLYLQLLTGELLQQERFLVEQCAERLSAIDALLETE